MKNRGAITMVFDDGYQEVYDEVLPLLALYNVHAVFAVPLSNANSNDWLDAATIHGHEIAAHSIKHKNLTTLLDTELQKELIEPKNFFQATTLVYPGGGHNDHVIAMAKEHYTAGRTVVRGLETLPPKDVFRLKTINFSKRNFSVLRANIHALQAWAQNRWLIETYHMVSKHPSSLVHSVLLSDLDAHLDFITSLPIRIGTIYEMI